MVAMKKNVFFYLIFGFVFLIGIGFCEESECPPHTHPYMGGCSCDDGYIYYNAQCMSCDGYCKVFYPNGYGIYTGGECECYCEKPYIADGGECLTCDEYCSGYDPYAHGEIQGDYCQCVCNEGYVMGDYFCEEATSECDSFCKDADPNSKGKMQGEECYCECKEGYYYIQEQGKCVNEEEYMQEECESSCKETDPNAYGTIEGEDCWCNCNEGFVYLEEEQRCASETEYEDIACNAYCEDNYWHAYGIVEEEGCNCYCEEGFTNINDKCSSAEESCNAECKNLISHSYGLLEGEDCACYCINGYIMIGEECKEAKEICDSACKGADINFYGVPNGEDCDCFCVDGFIEKNGVCEKAQSKEECNEYCKTVPNSHGVLEELNDCSCVCDEGYVASEGACVEKLEEVPEKDELKDKFGKDGMTPEPNKPGQGISEERKEEIKEELGLDLDEFDKSMGNGKKAYVIITENAANRLEWLVPKSDLLIDFYSTLGYEVEYLHLADGPAVARALADPNAGAIAYLAHAKTPTIEAQPLDDLKSALISARADWYLRKNPNQEWNKVFQKATQDVNKGLGFEMFYSFTCHSFDDGWKPLADFLIGNGGRYYGETGWLLRMNNYPDELYVKGVGKIQ